jgi:hypothetical protein
LPVGLGHEAGQGAEPADAHHDQVAFFARGNRDLFQASRLFLLSLQRSAFQQTTGQSFSAMGGYQL